MSRLFYHVCQDNAGNLLFGVQGTMRIAGTGTNATIYGDEALTVILPNPMTNHSSFASFKCFLGAGDYDFYLAKGGYTFETLTGVQGHGTMAQQDASAVAITGGTAFLDAAQVNWAAQTGYDLTVNRLYTAGLSRFIGPATFDAAAIAWPAQAGYDLTGNRLYAAGVSHFNSAISFGSAAATRTNLGLGTMAQQDAVNVAITGGSAQGLTSVAIGTAGGAAPLHVTGAGIIGGQLQVGANLVPTAGLAVHYVRASEYGIRVQPTDNDTGPGHPVRFVNVSGAEIGAIVATASAVAYNTSSDARLKHAITPLTGALDVVRALKPVSYLWNADGSPGRGLLAGEVQEVIPDGVITGERGAIDDDGRILPQMIDYSKLVPYLVGAVKELTQQVEMLQAQLAAAGA